MEIGVYLSKHADDNFRINAKLEVISRLKKNVDVPLKALIPQMETEVDNAIDAFVDDGNWIEKQINRIQNERMKNILENRYLRFLTWDEISDKMDISVDELPFYCGQAITLLEQNYDKAVS